MTRILSQVLVGCSVRFGGYDLDDTGTQFVVGRSAIDEAEQSLLVLGVAVERVAAAAGFGLFGMRLGEEGLIFVFGGKRNEFNHLVGGVVDVEAVGEVVAAFRSEVFDGGDSEVADGDAFDHVAVGFGEGGVFAVGVEAAQDGSLLVAMVFIS